MLNFKQHLLLLAVVINLLNVVLRSASVSGAVPGDALEYVYDHYYASQVTSQFQFRDCIDHRDFCTDISHFCPDDNDDDIYTSNDNDDEALKRARWMVAHCPLTCNVCETHQIVVNVPYKQSILYETEIKIQKVPNEHNFHSKIDPKISTYDIRDAMTGNDGFSNDAIGVQYLMSTTTALHNGVTYEQRNEMIHHVLQTQRYYTSTALPMIQRIGAGATTTASNNTTDLLSFECRNKSPYCTYWAVIYDRCNDTFYHQVMNKHCPVTCQRCQEVISNSTTTTTTESDVETDPIQKNVSETESLTTTTMLMDGTTTDDDDDGA